MRTGRVRDQVAVTQTTQALSPSLHLACLTEKREEGGKKLEEKVKNRQEETARQIGEKHDIQKKRGGKVH